MKIKHLIDNIATNLWFLEFYKHGGQEVIRTINSTVSVGAQKIKAQAH